MNPVRNPFAAGAGVQPPELAGRQSLLRDAGVMLTRLRQGRHAKSFIAVGLRGVGKTVLLNRVRALAERSDCKVVFIEAHEQKNLPELLVPSLRELLLDLDRLGAVSEQVKRALRVLRSFISGVKLRYGEAELSLGVDPEHGSADSGDLESDLPTLFLAVGKAAEARKMAVVVMIDELQYLSIRDMSALIMALHRVVQNALPLVLVAAGLPQVVGLSGRSKSYAERLFDFPPLEALPHDEAIRALDKPVREAGAEFATDALAKIVEVTQGYPYFLQEWGYQAWNVAPSNLIRLRDVEEASSLAVRRLDESFFRVRFDRLTPREKDYLRAMAEIGPGPHRSGEVADMLGIRIQNIAPLRSALIHKGMVYSPAHGDTAFTVPLFDAFLRRTIPEWETPYKRQQAT